MSEEWKSVVGYEGYYEISSHGRVRSVTRTVLTQRGLRTYHGRILKQAIQKYGHRLVNFSRGNKTDNYSVHRLVATAFIRPPKNREVTNHLDENPGNNVPENLEWTTTGDNIRYSAKRSPHKFKFSAKLTPSQVKAIRERTSEKRKSLAFEFGVSRQTIDKIMSGESWATMNKYGEK